MDMYFNITNANQSAKLQEVLFARGYRWEHSGQELSHLSKAAIIARDVSSNCSYKKLTWAYGTDASEGESHYQAIVMDTDAFIAEYWAQMSQTLCFPTKEATSTSECKPAKDAINPSHYKSHPSGIECVQVTEHMDFLVGNVFKYLWRVGLKDETKVIEDMEKAAWYLNRAIEKAKKEEAQQQL